VDTHSSILKVYYWHKKGWWIPAKLFKRLLFCIQKAGGYPPSILKVIIGIKKAGGYPLSILKNFYWHTKRLVDTHQAF
jgi:hypothetical protein